MAGVLPSSFESGLNSMGRRVLFTNFGMNSKSNLFSTFFDYLYKELMENYAFTMLLDARIDNKLATDIGKDIAEVLSQEFRLDRGMLTEEFVNALTHINPGSKAEIYAKALANTSVKILMNNNILKSLNDSRLLKSVAEFISGSLYVAAEEDNELEEMLETTDDDSTDAKANYDNENLINAGSDSESGQENKRFNYEDEINSGVEFSGTANANFDGIFRGALDNESRLGLNVNTRLDESGEENFWQNEEFDLYDDSGTTKNSNSRFNQNFNQESYSGFNTKDDQGGLDSDNDYRSKIGKPGLAENSNYAATFDPRSNTNNDPRLADDNDYATAFDPKSSQNADPRLENDNDYEAPFDTRSSTNADPRSADNHDYTKPFDPRSRKNTDPSLSDDDDYAEFFDPSSSTNTDPRSADNRDYTKPFDPKRGKNTDPNLADDDDYDEFFDPRSSEN
ncbi:hypothetical protein NPIL_127901, partial [Nephila pilipes]